MAERRIIMLSLVERGWQAARECSLDVQQQGISVVHLIKGYVAPEVRALITPYSHIQVVSVPRELFWPFAWLYCAGLMLTGRLRCILVDRERSLGRVRNWLWRSGVSLVMVQEGRHGYELCRDRQPLAQAAWYATLGIHEACADL